MLSLTMYYLTTIQTILKIQLKTNKFQLQNPETITFNTSTCVSAFKTYTKYQFQAFQEL